MRRRRNCQTCLIVIIFLLLCLPFMQQHLHLHTLLQPNNTRVTLKSVSLQNNKKKNSATVVYQCFVSTSIKKTSVETIRLKKTHTHRTQKQQQQKITLSVKWQFRKLHI